MAGAAGMGYSFAAHFSPAPPAPAMRTYRDSFQPSAGFAKPHAILGVAAVCAESEQEARELASTMELAWLRIHSGQFLPLPRPSAALAHRYSDYEREALQDFRARTIVGTPAPVDRTSTRLNHSHYCAPRQPSSALNQHNSIYSLK